jgi:hypothetical protein
MMTLYSELITDQSTYNFSKLVNLFSVSYSLNALTFYQNGIYAVTQAYCSASLVGGTYVITCHE